MKSKKGMSIEDTLVADSHSSEESDSDTSDSFSLGSSDDENEGSDEAIAGGSGNQGTSKGSDMVDEDENEDEEEDKLVKAIMNSKELQRDHPPTITTDDFIVDISFHPHKDLIALASISGDVLLYTYNNEQVDLKSTLELHLKACRGIEFSEDGRTLFSTAKDSSIMLTDMETEKLQRAYENAHENPIYSMTIISEHTFATGDDSGVVKLWDLRQKGDSAICSLKHMEDYVSDMITNKDCKYLVCASGDGSLTTFNIPARKMHVQSEEYDEELTCLGLFKSETKLLASSSKGKMYVFNWGEFGLHSDEFPSVTKKSINCMVPITENVVVTGGEDGLLRAISIFPHRHLGIVGQQNSWIESMDICNDGTLIASSSHNNEIKFWNVKYFETLDTSVPLKGGKQKQLKHNLPSSKMQNPSDFFSDLC